jgi:low temperature requirement protein LtrA
VSRQQEVQPAARVSTLELFFDLVFVFTVTQLTDVFAHHTDGVGLARVLLMLWVIWWMYSGYAWLTNVVAPSSTTRRTLLLTGMAGFLIIALAIPDAFDGSGWAFGAGYLVVNLVHTTLFLGADIRSSARAMRSLAPWNFGSALLVLAGGLLPLTWRYALWAAAVAVQLATPYLHRLSLHTISPSHFVERHALVVIIAIGESIVAIGLGFAGLEIDLGVILVAVLGLCIAYYLWWAYFARNNERSAQVLEATTAPLRRAQMALHGWGYAHYPLLLGIVLLSAGVKKIVGHAFDPIGWAPAVALGTGSALFLLGHAWFLRVLRLDGVVHRVAAAVAVLATIPLGQVMAVAQLAAIPVIMAAALIIEDVPYLRREHSTRISTFGR